MQKQFSLIQEIFTDTDVSLFVKREDLLFPTISGNKYRKLKYNLQEAKALGHDTLLTFGGAFSNHIAAIAVAGKEYGFKTIGIIRGDELSQAENPTLKNAADNGMKFRFISREAYRKKESASFVADLESVFGCFYLLPEGGTNALAIKGCIEIMTPDTADFDYICCATGTGGTLCGLIEGSAQNQHVIGFPALKDNSLKDFISQRTMKTNWDLQRDYTFGGYAKVDATLVDFMNEFYHQTGVPTDPVYTAKMFFGVMDLIKTGYFKSGSRILAIHTGGLQGIAGMNLRLKKMNLPLIHYV